MACAGDASPAAVPLKFFLKRKGKVAEIRRLREAGVTLERVRELAAQWLPRSLTVHYYDDDGDYILMETEAEWTECVRLWTARGEGKPVQLYIEPRKEKDEKKAAAEAAPAATPAAAGAPAPAGAAKKAASEKPAADVAAAKGGRSWDLLHDAQLAGREVTKTVVRPADPGRGYTIHFLPADISAPLAPSDLTRSEATSWVPPGTVAVVHRKVAAPCGGPSVEFAALPDGVECAVFRGGFPNGGEPWADIHAPWGTLHPRGAERGPVSKGGHIVLVPDAAATIAPVPKAEREAAPWVVESKTIDFRHNGGGTKTVIKPRDASRGFVVHFCRGAVDPALGNIDASCPVEPTQAAVIHRKVQRAAGADVEFVAANDGSVLAVLRDGFPNGGEPWADVHAPWGTVLPKPERRGPLSCNGHVVLQLLPLPPSPGAAAHVDPQPAAAAAEPAAAQPPAKPRSVTFGDAQPARPVVVESAGEQQQVASAVLERLFGPDIFARLSSGKTMPEKLGHGAPTWLSLKVLGRGDVDVDINTQNLARVLNARACGHIERRELADAQVWLDFARRLNPACPIVCYNMGCVRAMEGDAEAAMLALEQAVENGYKNAEHMAVDDDLESLHGDTRFRALVARLGGRVPEPPAPEPEPPVPEPEPVYAAELRQLHAMGLTDDDRSLELLREHGGNVQLCVCILLDDF